MNTRQGYERRLNRTVHESESAAATAKSSLAVDGDPSRPEFSSAAVPGQGRPPVAWVRLSELPSYVGAPYARRGIDLHAELVRRARRTPGAVVSSTRAKVRRSPGLSMPPDSPPMRNDAGRSL